MCVVLLLSAIHTLPLLGYPLTRRERTAHKLKEVLDASAKSKADQLKVLDDTGNVEPNPKHIETMTESLKEAAKSATGTEKILLDASNTVISQLRSVAKSYESARSAFVDAGGLDPVTIKAKADLDARLTLLSAWRSTAMSKMDTVSAAGMMFQRALTDAGMPIQKAQGNALAFSKGLRVETVRKAHQADIKLFTAAEKQLKLLKAEWGKWSASNDGAVSFENQSAIDPFNASLAEINAANDEILKAQRELLLPD